MATQIDLQTQLDKIEQKLRSGIESVTTDGTTTKVDLDQLRMERNTLRKQIASHKARRPTVARIDLGGF